jgi:hypothetical protein
MRPPKFWWRDPATWDIEAGSAWDFDGVWEWGAGLPKLRGVAMEEKCPQGRS